MAAASSTDSALKRARLALNMTLEEAADALNAITGGATDASLMSAWESGRRRTGKRNRAGLCQLDRERPEVLFAHHRAGHLVGLLVEIPGGRPGPWWTLDACVDTAPYGDETAWSFPSACGDIVDGWLRGRGSADSTLAAAMFCHIAADLAPPRL